MPRPILKHLIDSIARQPILHQMCPIRSWKIARTQLFAKPLSAVKVVKRCPSYRLTPRNSQGDVLD